MSTACPSLTLLRSSSPTFATHSISPGVDHLADRSARFHLVAFAVFRQCHSAEKNPPADRSFFSKATRPSIGAVTRIFSMLSCAWSMANFALFRFSSASAMVAWSEALRDCTSCSSSARTRLRLFKSEIIFSRIDCTDQFIFLNIEFGTPHVETSFQERDLILCAVTTAASALAFVISCSACSNSERFCSSL